MGSFWLAAEILKQPRMIMKSEFCSGSLNTLCDNRLGIILQTSPQNPQKVSLYFTILHHWPIGALQDERYSYVVIRKEPRPEMGSPLSISRHRQDAAELESHSPYLPSPNSWRKSESKMRQAAQLQEVLDGEAACACWFSFLLPPFLALALPGMSVRSPRQFHTPHDAHCSQVTLNSH